MTVSGRPDNATTIGVFVITVLVNVRDQHGNLVRTNQEHLLIEDTPDLRAEVLGLVREHWPEAEREDLEWHDDPDALVEGGEAWWTTTAEVDGVVRVVRPEPINWCC